jgi:peroxiredoxin
VIAKYDRAEVASWLQENDWTMPILCDGREVIERYGILNQQALSNEDHAGIPHPTTLIIDKTGVIRFKNVWIDYKKRTSPDTMLSVLADIND